MLRALILIFAALALSPVARGAAVPPEIADCRAYRIWQFGKDAGGWLADHNVSRFRFKDGVLSFTNTGPDPWITNRRIGGSDAASFRFIGIKMRASKDGANQIYFATEASPVLAEDKRAQQAVIGDGKWRFYELDMSALKTWTGRITHIRIDPVNGTDEVGAKVDINWIALYQRPARLTLGRPYAGLAGEQPFVGVPITNTGGEAFLGSAVARVGTQEQRFELLDRGAATTLTFSIPPGSSDILGTVEVDGKRVFDLVMVSPYAKDSGVRELANENAALRIPDIRPVNRCTLSAKPATMAVMRPLATLACRKPDGSVSWMEVSADSIESADDHSALLRAVRKIGTANVSFTWTFELKPGDPDGSMTCELASDSPLEVLRFEGPRMLAGESTFGSSKTHAIFPGLEYLEKDEPSSAMGHTGPQIAKRLVPHPYKVAVPLMAVEADGAVVGLSWDPMAEWAAGKRLPCAQFDSPNRSQGARNHLMSLFAPSIPDYVQENAELATDPYVLKPGRKMRIAARFFARTARQITDVIPDYYAAHGLPRAAPVAHGVEGTIDLCFRAYTESLYSAEAGGWKNYVAMGDKHSFRSAFAATILGESLRRGRPVLPRKCGIDPEARLTAYLGTTLDWFTPGYRAAADAAVARQSPDGGFGYQISEQMRKSVADYAKGAGVETDLLGELGATNSGLIARDLAGILSVAIKTGDARLAAAGLSGLEKMNSFTVPRGAQTWEVHAHTPDIYAAGLCIDCNISGYHLTGDEKYLDQARFWAYTGLPMVYGWAPPIDAVSSRVLTRDERGEGKATVFAKPQEFFSNPKRLVNPGATIPVLGSSFYIVSWFGVPVQWCGLAWANSVRRYTRLRPDPVLDALADAVFASGTQQQFDKGYLAGTYPDAWNLITNTAQMVFISPDLILDYAYALIGEKKPTSTDDFGFGTPRGRAFFSTFARVDGQSSSPDSLTVDLRYYVGQDVYSSLARVERPSAVIAQGRRLAEVSDVIDSHEGYHYDETSRALHVKFRPARRTATLSIKW